jgi:hypothetical protein
MAQYKEEILYFLGLKEATFPPLKKPRTQDDDIWVKQKALHFPFDHLEDTIVRLQKRKMNIPQRCASTTIQRAMRSVKTDKTVMVVRNPWDRVVSDYFYHKRRGFTGSFKDFIPELKPLVDYHADVILRFEHLQKDFNTFLKSIGQKPFLLPRLNTTKHKHYSTYYDDKKKEYVRKRYAKDIETFGYRFEKSF